MYDKVEKINKSIIQHGECSNRVYLMKLAKEDLNQIVQKLELLASQNNYGKIFAKVPDWAVNDFTKSGYDVEAKIPEFYNGDSDCFFLAKYPISVRQKIANTDKNIIEHNLILAKRKAEQQSGNLSERFSIRELNEDDLPALAGLYKEVFETYPFPIYEVEYLKSTMEHIFYYGVFAENQLVAASSSETDLKEKNVEMTDFATLKRFLGNNLSLYLLDYMEKAMQKKKIITSYTIARAFSAGMNITFSKMGYLYTGTLINNTNISGKIEPMNVWFKKL